MYFAATTIWDTSKHCIGAAISATILGPYTPLEPSPLFCNLTIDASGFKDTVTIGGKSTTQRYVAYKIDGNSLGKGGACNNDVAPYVATPLLLQPVAADGYTARQRHPNAEQRWSVGRWRGRGAKHGQDSQWRVCAVFQQRLLHDAALYRQLCHGDQRQGSLY